MQNKRVLITGCGSDIAISIAQILREAGFKFLIGTDIHPDHPGELFFDKCLVIPRAEAPNYFEVIEDICSKENISIILPISEIEISRFNKSEPRNINDTQVLMPDKTTIDICLNKLKTMSFLKEHGIPTPWTKLVSSGPPISLPCIIKHPESQGSKSVSIVDAGMVDHLSRIRPEFIWQELLLPNDEEYTCGLYRSKTSEIRTIQIRRKLLDGISVSGTVTNNPDIEHVLHRIAEALDLRGSINVQLRLTQKSPMTFEINPRFSSTVRFRHMLGFQDVLWSLNELLGLKIPAYSPPETGKKIFRVGQEHII